MTQARYDAIIIGAGHNGLTAAAYLAKAGLSVLVLEKRHLLGGAAATEEVYPGFRFDTGSHDAGLFLDSIVRDLDLEKHGLRFLESEVVAFSPQQGGDSLTLWRDLDKSVDNIARLSQADADRFSAFVDSLEGQAKMLREVLNQAPPEPGFSSFGELFPWLRTGLKLRRQGQARLMEFIRVLPLTVKEYLDEWFENELLKGTLAGPAISGGTPGVQGAGSMFMLLYQQGSKVNGGCRACRYVRGGIGQLSDALADAARSHVAEIRTGEAVERILLDKDATAAGSVQLASGEIIKARSIISNADPKRTVVKLVGGEHLEPHYMREVTNIRYRGSTAKVNLALKTLPTFGGVSDERQLSGHISISPTLDYLERAWDDAKYGRISEKLHIDASIPTLLDPALAPEGSHILSATVQYAPYRLKDSDWEIEREALGNKVISTLAQYAPDLPGLIMHRQVMTPLDLEREFGLTEGHIYHGQMGLDQLLSMRPVPGYASYRTPFGHLYLCGAGTHPGGGLTGAPGKLAAEEILNNSG
jgi:phytoene dehydrogenase-like protein